MPVGRGAPTVNHGAASSGAAVLGGFAIKSLAAVLLAALLLAPAAGAEDIEGQAPSAAPRKPAAAKPRPVRRPAAPQAGAAGPTTAPVMPAVVAAPLPPITAPPSAPLAAPLPAPLPAPPPAPWAVGPVAPLAAPQVTVAPVVVAAPQLTDWRPLDVENTLVIDTGKGRIVVELRPEFAPESVARVKRLARTRVYDGLLFHRVVEGFVAQTGNPNNLDGGKSLEPNLPPEFTFRLGAEIPRTIAATPQGESEGFIGAQPYVSVDELRMQTSPDRRVTAWGAYCAGVMGMGHDDGDVASGNSEIFFMRQTTRRLDRAYTVVGRVILGLDVVRALAAGDPPLQPDRMIRARVMADIPNSERPNVWVLNTLSPQFRAMVDQVREQRGADFSICDVDVPVRIDGAWTANAPPAEPTGRRKTGLIRRR